MAEPLYIFGTSGFAREVRDIAATLGWSVVFVAATQAEADRWNGHEQVIREDVLPAGAISCAIGIGDNSVRRKVANRYADRLFPCLIHPSASFGDRQMAQLSVRKGVIICAGVRFTNNIEVGDFSIFNLNCTVGHDVIVGDFVNIAPGANVSGYVELQERVSLGTNSCVNQGNDARRLVIAANTMIGSGSVVVKDCEGDSVYVGIPARKRQ